MKTTRSSRIVHYGKVDMKYNYDHTHTIQALCGKYITNYELQTGEQKRTSIPDGVTCIKCIRAMEKGKVYKDEYWK